MPSGRIERDLADPEADAATAPSLEEVPDRAGRRTGGAVTFADAVETVREDHDRR